MLLITLSLWKILGIISIIGLILAVINPMGLTARTGYEKYMHFQSMIWGPLVLSGIIGIIVAFFRDGDYDWNFVIKFPVIGILIGMMGELFAFIKRKKVRNKERKKEQ